MIRILRHQTFGCQLSVQKCATRAPSETQHNDTTIVIKYQPQVLCSEGCGDSPLFWCSSKGPRDVEVVELQALSSVTLIALSPQKGKGKKYPV